MQGRGDLGAYIKQDIFYFINASRNLFLSSVIPRAEFLSLHEVLVHLQHGCVFKSKDFMILKVLPMGSKCSLSCLFLRSCV